MGELKPQRRRRGAKREGIYVDYILDLETEGWDKFVLGGFLDVTMDRMEFYDHHNEQALVDRIMELLDTPCYDENGNPREVVIWAHNGGRYDGLWLCDWLVKLGVPAKIFASSARITLIRIRKEGTTVTIAIRDSAALVPMSLEAGAKIGNVPKSKTGLPCKCCKFCCRPGEGPGLDLCRREFDDGRKCKGDCGGYCSIARDMPQEYWEALKVYLKQDCRATGSMLTSLELFAKENDLDLCGTVGASSWTTAKRRYKLPSARWSGRHYKFARTGYYGGRTQVFRPLSAKGWRYDVNAAYISALSKVSLPIGKPRFLGAVEAARAFEAGLDGIYQATVEVDRRTHIPPLPWRGDDGRLHYPTGRFSGAWTRLELVHALSIRKAYNGVAGGCEVLSWGQALVWDQSGPLMAPFALMGWNLRDQARSWDENERWWKIEIGCPAGKDSALGKWMKWFDNSATGKLAQKPEADEVVMAPINPKPCPGGSWCNGVHDNVVERCCDHRCHNTCGKFEALDKWGTVWSRKIWRIPENGHVHWAAYLTSHARICLHKQLIADGMGGRSCVYCDTDSCYAEIERHEDKGRKLGQWLEEGEYTEFEALAPKTYSYIDEKGKRQVRAKGMFDPDWHKLKAHEEIPVDRGVIQFKSAARSGEGFFKRRDFTRSSQHDGVHFGDRTYDANEGVTVPTCLEEMMQVEVAA